MSRIPAISVVIPTYNRADMVCRCIQSILDADWPNLEVIVVDDCSPDDTGKRIAESFGERIKYLRNAKNSFQAVSRNRGAQVSSGDYLFFLDDDNIVDKDIFKELAKAFRDDPDLGLAAPMAIHMRPGKSHVIWSLGSDFNRWTSQPVDVATEGLRSESSGSISAGVSEVVSHVVLSQWLYGAPSRFRGRRRIRREIRPDFRGIGFRVEG